MSASMVSGMKLRLPCSLLQGVPSNKEQSTAGNVMDFVDRQQRYFRRYSRQQFKVASGKIKDRYDSLAKDTGFQEEDNVWLYRPTGTRGKSPKLQPSWKGSCKTITRITYVVRRIQRHLNTRWWFACIHWHYTSGLHERNSFKKAANKRPYSLRRHTRPPPQWHQNVALATVWKVVQTARNNTFLGDLNINFQKSSNISVGNANGYRHLMELQVL